MAVFFKKIGLSVMLLLVLCFLPTYTFAASDYKADYDVQYFLTDNFDNIATKVRFTIQVVNLKSDVYVKKFSIAFPRTFRIGNINASDDQGKIQPVVTEEEKSNKIELEFTEPNTGKNSVNHFYLDFDQDNLFKVNGNVWEVILPTIENKSDSRYKITVNLPNATSRKLSIAKPNPDLVKGSQIIWNDPATKTVYAVFGDTQNYQTELSYHLKNPKLIPVYTDITFPTDTNYQKIYISSIQPAPQMVYLDEDGNYLGRYYLSPKETKEVMFRGIIEIYAKPRKEIEELNRSRIESQKKYLLNENKYWSLSDFTLVQNLKQPHDIYSFVVDNLEYNYKKVGRANERTGADAILKNPNQAVCTEFSDLFIAIAREKGIFAREMQGYAYSQDQELRPISLVSDVLHSWPEYYDPTYKTWVPIDPTWENTSGIDYFSSFDLNHVVFAIHAKKSDYPLPAGMFKLENSQDILIKPTKTTPEDNVDLAIQSTEFPSQINDIQEYTSKIVVKNNSNVFLTNVPVEVRSDGLVIQKNKVYVDILAPLETKELSFTYRAANKNMHKRTLLQVFLYEQGLFSTSISVFPYAYELGIKFVYILFGLSLILFVFFRFRKSRVKKTFPGIDQ